MRRFVCSLAALAVTAAFSATSIAQQKPAAAGGAVNLKMQATWPASLTLYENFLFFADRVDKLSAGTLKITTMPAGQVVPAFEVLDATHKKVLDGAHAWAGYWVGKNKTSILFTGGPGGTFGMDYIDAMGWMYEGGGLDLYNEFYQKELKLNVVVLPILPAGPQAFGWFKRPIKSLADFKGMKCRQTGMAAEVFQKMGMQTVNMPGGEIIPSAQRGVIDCAEWIGGEERQAPRFPQRLEIPLHAGRARERHDRRAGDQRGRVEGALAAASGNGEVGDDRDLLPLVGQVAAAERRCDQGTAGEARRSHPAHAARHPDRVPEGLGQDRGGRGGQEPVLQEDARLAARLREPGRAGQALHVPAVFLRRQLLLPGGETRGEGRGEGQEVAPAME
jgi:hypothetical protein